MCGERPGDALHVVIGVAVWLGLALIIRRPLSSFAPWLGLAGFILWNEAVDLRVEHWPDRVQQYREGAKDFVLTLLIPTILLLLVRYQTNLFRAGRLARRGP